MSPQERSPHPQFRPGYLLAAAAIWAAILASVLAGPAPQPVQMARLDCAAR